MANIFDKARKEISSYKKPSNTIFNKARAEIWFTKYKEEEEEKQQPVVQVGDELTRGMGGRPIASLTKNNPYAGQFTKQDTIGDSLGSITDAQEERKKLNRQRQGAQIMVQTAQRSPYMGSNIAGADEAYIEELDRLIAEKRAEIEGKKTSERIALENGVREKCKLPTGWCSWYYYGPDIFQECILENMEYAKKENLPIDYIQIDDGWQKCYGDWEPNDRFSMGMKELADKIKENGYTPGIWVAPFLFAADSKTFHDNPDFFIKNPNGEFHPNRLIDYSVKEARQWLYDLAHKLSVEWGYRYIKIDLISYRLAISGYKKKGFNAIKNFREAIKIMRSAVTPDTVFLTCTAPLGASAGIAECVRISDDIFERWDSLRAVAKQVFRRYFINEYINTDPDCLMVRTEDKHDAETFRICVRDEREIKTFVNFMSASGGAVMLSDKFSLLDDTDFAKIRTLFPINEKPAIPLDLFEREIPSVLYYGNRLGVDVYAIFNWSNAEDTITVPVEGKKYIRSYYGKTKDCVVDSFSLTLAPHDSEIIYMANDKEKFDKLGESIL